MGQRAPALHEQARVSVPAEVDPRTLLAGIVENSEDAILSKTLAGNITSWNRGAEELFGYAAEEVIGASVLSLIPPELIAEELAILERIARGERIRRYETRRHHKNGTVVVVSLTVSPLRDSSGRVVGAASIARDVTESKVTRQELEKFYAFAEHSSDFISMAALSGQALYLNPAGRELVGLTDEDDVLKTRMPDYLPAELHGLFSDTVLLQTLSTGSWEGELKFKHFRTGALIDVWQKLFLVRNPRTREPLCFAAIVRDISERMRTETALREAREQLRRYAGELEELVAKRTASLQEKVAELEAYSYSISHDLRSPLRALQSYSEILLEDYGARLEGDGKDYLERIARAASRLDRLIQDVLTYSRVSRAALELAPVDLNRLIRDIVDQYPGFQPPAACVQVQNPLLPILGHEASLTQCISNLLSNAVKFVPPGAVPRVRVWTELRTEPQDENPEPKNARSPRTGGSPPPRIADDPPALAGPALHVPCSPFERVVRLWIEDNGIGIAPADQERIFTIFERVHCDYEGTGIGLAIVRKAVERMGGKAGVVSAPGRGSKFWLQLPPATESKSEADTAI